MKRNIVLIAIVLLGMSQVFPQEQVLYNVVYDFEYVRDLSARDQPYRSDMILSIGKTSSRFCPLSEYNSYAVPPPRKESAVVIDPSKPTITVTGRPFLAVGNYGALYNEEVVKNIIKRNLRLAGRIGLKRYLVETPLPEINWEISDDKKQVAGYDCQKAVGQFKGRTYNVWFTPALPFQDGPWKLSGLPGLILEATDRTGEISFTAKSVEKNKHTHDKVESLYNDDDCIDLKEKDYNKAMAAFVKDPELYAKAQVRDGNLSIRNRDDQASKTVVKVKKYNPIELD